MQKRTATKSQIKKEGDLKKVKRKIIQLSEYLGVDREKLEVVGVLDIDLGIDSHYFVDPLLLYNTNMLELKNSREKILGYYREIIKIAKQSHLSKQLRDTAINMIAIKEPRGFSIGYGGKTDHGTAISRNVAKEILRNILEIISVGIENPELIDRIIKDDDNKWNTKK